MEDGQATGDVGCVAPAPQVDHVPRLKEHPSDPDVVPVPGMGRGLDADAKLPERRRRVSHLSFESGAGHAGAAELLTCRQDRHLRGPGLCTLRGGDRCQAAGREECP